MLLSGLIAGILPKQTLSSQPAIHRLLSACTSPTQWKPLQRFQDVEDQAFKLPDWDAQQPVAVSSFRLPPPQTWVSSAKFPQLNHVHLRPHADTTFLPMELSSSSPTSFQRVPAAPLSLFLHYATLSLAERSSQRLYVAQAGLDLLPETLRADFPTPTFLGDARQRNVYSTSLWMGIGGSATPLHRDPNHNLLIQVAGRKVVRLLDKETGTSVLEEVRRQAGKVDGRPDRLRGEEMMRDEKVGLERAIWEDTHPNVTGWEAALEPGDGLLIPQGWHHAVRGVGEGINISVSKSS